MRFAQSWLKHCHKAACLRGKYLHLNIRTTVLFSAIKLTVLGISWNNKGQIITSGNGGSGYLRYIIAQVQCP